MAAVCLLKPPFEERLQPRALSRTRPGAKAKARVCSRSYRALRSARPPSGRIDVAQRPDQPPCALVRLAMRRLVAGPGRAQFCQAVLTCHARGFRLDVHRPCNRGRAALFADRGDLDLEGRSEEHTSELQSLMRIS